MKAPDLPRAWYALIALFGLAVTASSAYALMAGLIDGNISVRARGFVFVGPAAITILVCELLLGIILVLSGWRKWI